LRRISDRFCNSRALHHTIPALAPSFFAQIEASRLNTNCELQRAETHVIRQEALAQSDTFILNLDNLSAIRAHDMESSWRLFTVHLIVTMLPVQLDLTDEMTVEHHWQRAVDGRQGNQPIDFARFG